MDTKSFQETHLARDMTKLVEQLDAEYEICFQETYTAQKLLWKYMDEQRELQLKRALSDKIGSGVSNQEAEVMRGRWLELFDLIIGAQKDWQKKMDKFEQVQEDIKKLDEVYEKEEQKLRPAA